MLYKNEFELARLISRKRLGILTPAEEKQLEEWLGTTEANRALYEQISEGNSFQSRLELEAGIDMDKARQQLDRKIKVSTARRWMWKATSAAAVILCGLMITFFWMNREGSEPRPVTVAADNIELIFSNGKKLALDKNSLAENKLPEGFEFVHEAESDGKLVYTKSETTAELQSRFITLKVPRKENYKIELPDGTVVLMNSCSSLRFPEQFKTDSREVYLSGEAAFAVKKDKNTPFLVHTDKRNIVVTGTQFNVSAYDDDLCWQTTLIEGAIEVTGGKETIVLKPYQQYSLNKGNGIGQLRDVPANEAVFAPWLSGILTFEAVPFEEIMQKLQRWYDITLAYEDDSAKKKRFTATVNKEEPLDVFLTLIEQTTDIKFIVKGTHITVAIKN